MNTEVLEYPHITKRNVNEFNNNDCRFKQCFWLCIYVRSRPFSRVVLEGIKLSKKSRRAAHCLINNLHESYICEQRATDLAPGVAVGLNSRYYSESRRQPGLSRKMFAAEALKKAIAVLIKEELVTFSRGWKGKSSVVYPTERLIALIDSYRGEDRRTSNPC